MAKDIKDIALKYLVSRERSAEDVKKYLRDKDFSESDIFEAIEYLLEFHYLDDKRFCDAYVRYSLSKRKGSYRIRQELREHCVEGESIELALNKYITPEVEKENAEAEVRKILENRNGVVDEKLKAKIGRRLSSLGYDVTLTYNILNSVKE